MIIIHQRMSRIKYFKRSYYRKERIKSFLLNPRQEYPILRNLSKKFNHKASLIIN